MRRFAVTGLLILSIVLGCGKAGLPGSIGTTIQKADSLDVYSLDATGDGDAKGEGTFHGWQVLGFTTVSDDSVRQGIIMDLDRGIRDHDGRIIHCFQPRHAIRAKLGKKTLDLAICFECEQMQVYLDGSCRTILLTDAPEARLDLELRTAGVRLAEKAKK